MVRLTILERARLAGLSVRADGDRLFVRGPRRLETLAREVLAQKAEIMAVLAQEDSTAWEDAIPLDPGDFKFRTLADLLPAEADRQRRRCYACRNGRWWRLKRGGPWTCGRCHPPTVGEASVVWAEGGAP